MKKCSKCKNLLDPSCFSKDSTKSDGLQFTCKECQRIIGKKYREKNPDYFKDKGKERYHSVGKEENKDRYAKYQDKYLARRSEELQSMRGRLYVIYQGAKDRSRRNNTVFELTLDWVMDVWNSQDGKCAMTGIPLTLDRNPNGERFYNPFNPSLDRIDSSIGYTKENTRLVAVVVNLALNKFGDEVFKKMCFSYVEMQSNSLKDKASDMLLATV